MGKLADFIEERLQIVEKTPRAASIEATGNPDTIRNIQRGKSANPRSDTLHKLAPVLGVTPEAMMAAALQDLEGVVSVNLSKTDPLEGGLKVSGYVAAGVWLDLDQAEGADDVVLPITPDPRFPKDRQFAVRVQGNSINKIASDGQYLLCLGVDYSEDGQPLVETGDLAVIERIRSDGLREATVKRVRLTDDGWELHPESTESRHSGVLRLDEGLFHDEEGFEVRVIGKVLWAFGYLGGP